MPSAVRASMGNLIARVRTLIADPSGSAQVFGDDQIQDRLDRSGRVDVVFMELKPRFTLVNSAIVYTDYFAPAELGGDWEEDAKLYNLSYQQVTPTTSDYVVGHWTFTGGSFPNGLYPPVIIYGKVYDCYRVAADLLEMRAVLVSSANVDFSADGHSFRLSQIPANYMALAKQYRKQAKPRAVAIVRDDLRAAGYSARAAAYGAVSAGVPFLTGS